MSKRQARTVELSSHGVVLAVLDQAIVRVVGSIWGRSAGVVFECVVGGHVAFMS